MFKSPFHRSALAKKNKGIGLIEIIIAIAIIGGIIGVVIFNQTRANNSQNAVKTASDLVLMAGKIKQFYGQSNSYVALSPASLSQMALIAAPMKYDGTNMVDPFGNNMTVNGGIASFGFTLGGAASPLDKEVCAEMAAILAGGASAVRIGADAAIAAGVISGGVLYKTGGTPPDTAALATGCNATAPIIAFQFR